MSTLVTTHGGLERITRTAEVVTNAIRPRNAAGRRIEERAKALGGVGAWFARWVEAYRLRQQERAFESLMNLDPRVRAEIDAAATRASSDR